MPTKYEQVKNELREKILSGEFPINSKLPTEAQLMAAFNMSRYTIRRAMSDLENEHFLYKVQGGGTFVDNWQQEKNNNIANGKLIGMITTHVAHYIFPNIISGVDRYISGFGYTMLLANTHNNPKRERQALLSMLDNHVSGLIVEPSQSAIETENRDIFQQYKELGIPIIFINAVYEGLDYPVVKQNDELAEQHLIEYLFELGHEQVLGVFQVDDLQGIRRMNGFVRAYQQHASLAISTSTVMYRSTDPISHVMERIASYLQMNPHITAIAAYNDQLAIEIYDLVRSMDLRVPEDVSVVGFDDYLLSGYLQPQLTTMTHEKEHMGRDAAELLLKRIDGEEVKSIDYTPEFIQRDSVRDLKK